ncbi:MAG TPA: outer membrane beta-barrel protein [Tepidisphaeraceae bacterium]|jgi:hypothetical protein|nr:outer membrane beta-barrel protein [Tepidisphaeraceae bacterium]
MLHRNGVAKLAVCAAMACATVVGAEEIDGAGQDKGIRPLYLQDSQPASAPSTEATTAPAPPPPKALMAGLEAIGVGKALEDANITVGGYVEGGYTISFSKPPNDILAGRVFDTKNNSIVLDQLDFFFDRPVDYGKAATNHTIDIGGHFDFIYGWDSGLIHSSGIFDSPGIPAGVGTGFYDSRTHPENQADFTQAYVDLALPIGSGLRLRFGKFVTLFGYETINPTTNPFYSHTYSFGFAIPFTQTGIMGEYKLSDDWLLDAGITRGWNQSLKDNNGDPDFLGEVTWTPQGSDFLKKWKVIGNVSLGPQTTNDNSNWWTVLEAIASYAATDKWSFAADLVYGDAPHANAGASAQWYGIAGYGAYVFNDYFTFNGRAEWYGDANSFTIGIPPGAQNLYEFTVNADIKPFPSSTLGQNLIIRPELRFDYSAKPFFNAGTKYDQLTFGIDAYYMF